MPESKRQIVSRSRLFACERGIARQPDCPCGGALFDIQRVGSAAALYTLDPRDPHYPLARSKRGTVQRLARIRKHALEVNYLMTPFMFYNPTDREIRAAITKAQHDVYASEPVSEKFH